MVILRLRFYSTIKKLYVSHLHYAYVSITAAFPKLYIVGIHQQDLTSVNNDIS